MAKTVYVETTIPNAYASGRNDAASVYRRDITRQWWVERARFYELRTSEATLAEPRAGNYPGQQQAIELVESLPLLDITDEVSAIAELYVRHQLMPAPAAASDGIVADAPHKGGKSSCRQVGRRQNIDLDSGRNSKSRWAQKEVAKRREGGLRSHP